MTLPIKLSFLLFTSFTFVLILISKPDNVFAQNPQDIFLPSVEKLNQEQIETRKEAQDKNAVQINDLDIGSRQLTVSMFALTSNVIPICTDSEFCPKQPTALGTVVQLMDTLYANPPASGVAYVYDLLANAGLLAKPTHAQGIGFAALSPFLPLWRTARNIAYAILIIVMIAIGFMIIFRMKIDPKTVISIQAALPKIILTLIIITFSYAIVGFLVDIMYLVMAIMIRLMADGMGGDFARNVNKLQTQYMTGGVGTLFGSIFSGGFRSVDDLFKAFWYIVPGGTGVGLLVAAFMHAHPFGWAALIGASGLSLLFLLIMALGLLFTFFRLLMLLFNSYMQVLIAVIIGPIQLLTEAIPGRSAFSGWILNILANLVVFPATAALLMFAMYLTSSNITASVWTPPLIGAGAAVFQAFLGLSIIFIAPGLVASVKKIFHPKPALPITAGTAISPLTSSAQTAMGAASQFYYLQMTAAGLPFLRGLVPGADKHQRR